MIGGGNMITIPFFPIVEEKFVPITDDMVPGVKPYYMISNTGKVFSNYCNKLMSLGIDTKGYNFIILQTI